MRLIALTIATLLVAGCGSPALTTARPAARTPVAAASLPAGPTAGSHLYSTLDILGIGPVYADSLAAAGVGNAADLLQAGHTRSGRANLAATTGISPKLILRWVNHADLIRVTGAGPVYARMLEDAGVDTVAELAQRNPYNLRDAVDLVRTKGGKTLVERIPSVETLARWIRNAQELGRYVEY